jgi:lipoprotein NlpD
MKTLNGVGMGRLWSRMAIVVLMSILWGCSSPAHRAPVEERLVVHPGIPIPAQAAAAASSDANKPLPGAENAGKPGYYTVKAGDTLIRIGLDSGQNWKDLVRWNGLDNPNLIEVGQVVRVVPPGVDAGAASTRPVLPARVDGRPADPRAPVPGTGSAPAAAAVASQAVNAPSAGAPRDGDDDIAWAWPAAGPVLTTFEKGKVKGVSIAGKAGDAVLAAADGRVVYAGSGLRGYGNLIILKHNNTYLTAYAHNQTLLVKEDQAVRRGQRIADMGSTDSDVVKLHFEIRKQGRPVDPVKLLPAR